jgi:hypothetical protein
MLSIGCLAFVGLYATGSAVAQKDRLGIGETLGGKVIRGADRAEFDVELHTDDHGQVKTELKGELRYAKLPQHIRAALGFLVRWGRGPSTVTVRANPDPQTPVTVAGKTYALNDVRLLPPISGLSTVRAPDGAVAGVRVQSIAVELADGTVVKGAGLLRIRTEPDGWFTITAVEISARP